MENYKNVIINVNNFGCGTIVNDMEIEKFISLEGLTYFKEVSFQENDCFGKLKFFSINISFEQISKTKFRTLVSNLIELGESGGLSKDNIRTYQHGVESMYAA